MLWFSIGHMVLAMVVALQTAVLETRLTSNLAYAVFWVAFALFYMWGTADGERKATPLVSLFGSSGQTSTENLRSQYERQIGEAARQEERNRLARDLHDSVKQQIFAIQTAAATAQVRFESDSEGAKEALAQVRNAAREASSEMQAMLDQLRAAPLENTGLIAAVKQQCEALGFRTGAQVECRVEDLPDARDLPPGTHEALLRVTQEVLSNVARHARAKHVSLVLTSGGGRVDLQVRDDGAGFDATVQGAGQGLGNLQTRAVEFGGGCTIDTSPGGGTTVAFFIPYATAEPAGMYARRAWMFGAAQALLLAAIVWWRPSPGLTILSVMTLTGVVRNTVAWRRVRNRKQGGRL
ncbi:MAG: sensor histidine kinase [Bryobacterales bacterium]|nr:sensor histidine kinase [Bryobacterales bacterium]